MKTLGIILISVAGGAVGACILMRICKKRKLPCGCQDEKKTTTSGATTSTPTNELKVTPPLTATLSNDVDSKMEAAGTPNNWARSGILRTYDVVMYPATGSRY